MSDRTDVATATTAVFACGVCGHEVSTEHAPDTCPTPNRVEFPCPNCDHDDHETDIVEDAALHYLHHFEDAAGNVVSKKDHCKGCRSDGVERSQTPHPDAVDVPATRDMGRMTPKRIARLCYNLREGQRVLFNKRSRPLTVSENVEKNDDYSRPGDRLVVLKGNGTTYKMQVPKYATEEGWNPRIRRSAGKFEAVNWVWPEDGDIGILNEGISAADFVAPAIEETPTISYRTMREPDDIPTDAEWLGDCPRDCHGQVWGIENRAECDTCHTACEREQWDRFEVAE